MPSNLTLTSATFTAGKFANGMNGGKARAAGNVLPSATQFTVDCWVKGASTGAIRVAVSEPNAFWIGQSSTGVAQAKYGQGGTEVDLLTTKSLTDGLFHHLELVISAAGGKLFVDGVLEASSATTPTTANVVITGIFEVWGIANGVFPYTGGVVDEVAVWSSEKHTTTFTPETAAYAGTETNLVALYHLNDDGVDSIGGSPATAVTMTGASSGTVGVASTNFTVGANGAITGTVVVTPSDGGAGGTFTPTTVSISSGSPTGTFTYTAASTGAKTISVTNDGGLTNPSNITYTASASSTNPANSAGISYSPYNWNVNSTRAKTINAGAYFKTIFTGASCTLNFDLTGISTPYPYLVIRVDRTTLQRVQIASTVSVTMPTGQDNTSHLLEVVVDSTTETVNRWTSQANAVQLTGITLASGSETLTAPQVKPDTMVIYGDSITEGVRTLAQTAANDALRNSAFVCWPLALGEHLNCEVGVIGFGATGITVAGSGSVPKLPSSYNFLWSGQSRVFNPVPKYCVWLEGYNDGSTNTVTDGLAALNGMLSVMAGTKFVLFRPLSGTTQATNLQTIASTCNEPTRVAYVSTSGYWTTAESSDSVHPYGWSGVANIAPKMATDIKTAFPESGGSTTVTTAIVGGVGSVGITATGTLVAVL
jgi:hypothetical protein